jgi:hypothetical protein
MKGTAKNAPATPAIAVPVTTPSTTPSGCTFTAVPVSMGCRTWDSICCTPTTIASMISACTQPLNTSARPTATAPPTIAPTTGTKAPKKTTTAIGIASGTPRIAAPMPMNTASVAATTSWMRMKLVSVCQPAAPAARIRGCAARGKIREVQVQMCLPSMRANRVTKMTMKRPSRMWATLEPASAAPAPISEACFCSHSVALVT